MPLMDSFESQHATQLTGCSQYSDQDKFMFKADVKMISKIVSMK